MSIAPIPAKLRRYFEAFEITSIAVYGRRFRLTDNPIGADAAWWLPRDKVEIVLKRARRYRTDVVAAAVALDVVGVTPHHRALARAEAAIARLDEKLAQAKADGDLQFFNQQYRRRRIAAQTNGQPFPPYPVARQRLERAITSVIASGGALPKGGLMAAVFDAPSR